jgi:hypothetical protein
MYAFITPTQWLVNTAESIIQGDTSWSDLLSDVLKVLHKGSDAASEQRRRDGVLVL